MDDKTIPAFPTERIGMESGEVLTYQEEGMALRDYFAARALQGLISTEGAGSAERYAEISYRLADAMMKERLK
jgi:hypothetical protein